MEETWFLTELAIIVHGPYYWWSKFALITERRAVIPDVAYVVAHGERQGRIDYALGYPALEVGVEKPLKGALVWFVGNWMHHPTAGAIFPTHVAFLWGHIGIRNRSSWTYVDTVPNVAVTKIDEISRWDNATTSFCCYLIRYRCFIINDLQRTAFYQRWIPRRHILNVVVQFLVQQLWRHVDICRNSKYFVGSSDELAVNDVAFSCSLFLFPSVRVESGPGLFKTLYSLADVAFVLARQTISMMTCSVSFLFVVRFSRWVNWRVEICSVSSTSIGTCLATMSNQRLTFFVVCYSS